MSCIVNKEQFRGCPNTVKAGTDLAVYEYQFADFSAMVDAGLVILENDNSISSITNASGIKLYKKEVPDQASIVLGSPPNKVAGTFTTFTHTFNYPLINNKQPEKNEVVSKTSNAVVCIIVKRSGEAELFGYDQGMILVNDTGNAADADFGGIIPMELSTDPDGAKESEKPKSVFNTDLEGTIAMLEGLRTAGV